MSGNIDPIVEHNSRIVFVNPCGVTGAVNTSNGSAPLTPDYSDMCIVFNLYIESFSRIKNEKKNTVGLVFSTKEIFDEGGDMTVLGGTVYDPMNKSNYLSTYYTEISANGYKETTQVEGLGVESAQISYDSYYNPTVTIKFIDVRGSAVFGREEAIHTSEKADGKITVDNVYGIFFTVPYPKFKLQIKGFYGKDVTYQLALTNFTSQFNSKTGNFEITATFVGYTWALLTDIPLKYLIAAPYCSFTGVEYWNRRIQEGAFLTSDGAPMPTLRDLMENIRQCIQDAKAFVGNNAEIAGLSDTQIKLEDIIRCINNFTDVNSTKVKDIDEFKTTYEQLTQNISNYNTSVGEDSVQRITHTLPEDDSWYQYTQGDEYPYEINIEGLEELKSEVNDIIDNNNAIKDGKIEEAKQKYYEGTINTIGIIPKIQDVFKLLMCHLETFCHIMFDAATFIKEQTVANNRTPQRLNVNINKTDVSGLLPTEEEKSYQLPPWTAVFNDSPTVKEEDKTIYSNQFTWVGDLNHNWIEEDVVWGIYDAIRYAEANHTTEFTIYSQGNTVFEGIPCFIPDLRNSFNAWKGFSKNSFDTLCGYLGLRIAQILGTMGKQWEFDRYQDVISGMGEIDAVNFYLSDTTGKGTDLFFKSVSEGNAVQTIMNILCCNGQNEFASQPNMGENLNTFVFETQSGGIYSKNPKRHPMYVNRGNTYEYVYFYNHDKNKLIPPRFKEGFKNFEVYPYMSSDNLKYYAETTTKNTLTNLETVIGCIDVIPTNKNTINKDKFYIIDNDRAIASLINLTKDLKNNFLNTRQGHIKLEHGKEIANAIFRCDFENYKQLFSAHTFNVYNFRQKLQVSQNRTNVCYDISTLNDIIDSNDKSVSFGLDYNSFKNIENEEVSLNNLAYLTVDCSRINQKNEEPYNESLFFSPFYYLQNNINDYNERLKAKAYLFISNLRVFLNLETCCPQIFQCGFSVYSKQIVLLLGGLLWRQNNLQTKGNDGICYRDENSNINYTLNYDNKYIYIKSKATGSNLISDAQNVSVEDMKSICHSFKDLWGVDINEIDNNIKQQLIDYFERFATTDFVAIANRCEIKTDTKSLLSASDIIDIIDEFCQINAEHILNDETNNSQENEENNGVNSVETILNTKKSFKIPDNVIIPATYQIIGYDSTYKTITLIFNENDNIQNQIKMILFGRILLNNTIGCKYENLDGQVNIDKNMADCYLQNFVKKLKSLQNEDDNETENIGEYLNNEKNLNDNTKYSKDELLSIYLYCKNLWEKWLMPLHDQQVVSCTPNASEGNIILGNNYYDIENFFKNSFTFIDSFYHDIGYKLMLNFDQLYDCFTGRSEDSSLYTYIGDIVKRHRCMFVGLPDYPHLGMGSDTETKENFENSVQTMRDMFTPIPFSKIGYPHITNNFVIIYTYPPASKQPEETNHKYDGFDIYALKGDDSNIPEVFKIGNVTDNLNNIEYDKCYKVPSFGIAFGSQHNHMFKNLKLSVDNPVETETAINTMYNAIRQARSGDRRVSFYGQDVYNVFTNYCYQIEIEMMGNAQIQPLMYFQMMNTPMWRGAYMIFSVQHNITPGNMTTTFKAMKMSRIPVKLIQKYWTDMSDYYSPKIIGGKDENCLEYADVWESDGSVDTVGLEEFTESGQGTYDKYKERKHSTVNAEYFNMEDGCNSKTPKEYTNINANEYFNITPYLTHSTFTIGGRQLNLIHAINYIYNISHYDCSNKKVKDPWSSCGQCAGYVNSALFAGFGSHSQLWTRFSGYNEDYALKNAGFTMLYDNPGKNQIKRVENSPLITGSLPEYAYPGDIALLDARYHGKLYHAVMFTGKHWVSDFIQRRGMDSAYGAKDIYRYYRIPGIEQAYKPSGISSTSSNASNGGRYVKKCIRWANDNNNENSNNATYNFSSAANYKENEIASGVYGLSYLTDSLDRAKVLCSLLKKSGFNYAHAIAAVVNANTETGVGDYLNVGNYKKYNYLYSYDGTGYYSGLWQCAVGQQNGNLNGTFCDIISKHTGTKKDYITQYPVHYNVIALKEYLQSYQTTITARINITNEYAEKYNQPKISKNENTWDYLQSLTDPHMATGAFCALFEWGKGFIGRWDNQLSGHRGVACGPAIIDMITPEVYKTL